MKENEGFNLFNYLISENSRPQYNFSNLGCRSPVYIAVSRFWNRMQQKR